MENPVVLRAKKRVLFFILKKGRSYEANISQLARDMDASDGNVNPYVHQLEGEGLLREVPKGGRMVFRVTWKGQTSLFPLLLPSLLAYFIMIVALGQIIWAEVPLLTGVWILTPTILLFSGIFLLAFGAFMVWAQRRLDRFMLESKWSSNE